MAQIIVRMRCVTNLHVGNGDVNYNIIDNEVERDPVTGYPMIHSSGVKGAEREYFKIAAPKLVEPCLGSDKEGNTTQGKLQILPAELLAMPMRASAGGGAYYMATSETALSRYAELRKLFLGKETAMQTADCSGVALEGKTPERAVQLPFAKLCVLSDEAFRNIALPVMARNCLEDGRSVNLWYEEIVPHESIFFYPVLAYDKDRELLERYADAIDGKILQFGGNASIGYGLCRLEVER